MEHRNHYIAQTVNTASPAHLVTMLYDRLLLAIRRATIECDVENQSGNTEVCHNELVRAQRIVEELRFGLDEENGGEIASNLRSIYNYCHELLVTANIAKSANGLKDVEVIITDIREMWVENVDRGAVLASS